MPDTLHFTVWLAAFRATVVLNTPRRYTVSLRTTSSHTVSIR